jgi:ElaB/YqjD/DUF883 family membrane-anchored ribosome-binding protein
MRDDTAQLMKELQQLWGEFEKIVRLTRAALGERADEAAGEVRDGLDQAHDRLASIEARVVRDLKHGARVADGYVRDNTWAAIAVAAAAGALIGVLLAHRK